MAADCNRLVHACVKVCTCSIFRTIGRNYCFIVKFFDFDYFYNSADVGDDVKEDLKRIQEFIATKQIKENKEWRDKLGFKYINDLLVGCSKMDEWRYQDAFLKDWEMGARENNSPSQRWHIPVIDPKKIILGNELNIGGNFLKEKIDFAVLIFCR